MTIYSSTGTCSECGNPTRFLSKRKGYKLSCSSKCGNIRRWREIQNDPDKLASVKANMGADRVKRWADPEYKKRCCESMSLSMEWKTLPKHRYGNIMKGKFSPKNPNKYKGDPRNIQYRSSWELKLMNRFDQQPEVVWWQSEELIVPYRSPVDKRIHRYFVDFVFKHKDGSVTMVEVKPLHQTKPPVLAEGKRINKTYKNAVITYAINDAKWRAAKAYCADRGWTFKIITEKELFG